MHSIIPTMLRASLIIILAAPALAFGATQLPPGQAGHAPPAGAPATPPAMQQLPEIKGVVSWEILSKVKQVKAKDRILPEFTKDINALNDQEVKVQGYMMPLEPGEKQKHFLLSVNPQSCSYCLPAGPEGVVEVNSKTPVKYTFEPIVLSGKMAILKDDPMGLYYRLSNATPIAVK
jgi:uncharacterized protein